MRSVWAFRFEHESTISGILGFDIALVDQAKATSVYVMYSSHSEEFPFEPLLDRLGDVFLEETPVHGRIRISDFVWVLALS